MVTKIGVILGNYRAGKRTIAHAFTSNSAALVDGYPSPMGELEVPVTKQLGSGNAIQLQGLPIDFGRMPNHRAKNEVYRKAHFFVMVVSHADLSEHGQVPLVYFYNAAKTLHKAHCPIIVIGTVVDAPTVPHPRVAGFASSIKAQYVVFDKKKLASHDAATVKQLTALITDLANQISVESALPRPDAPQNQAPNLPLYNTASTLRFTIAPLSAPQAKPTVDTPPKKGMRPLLQFPETPLMDLPTPADGTGALLQPTVLAPQILPAIAEPFTRFMQWIRPQHSPVAAPLANTPVKPIAAPAVAASAVATSAVAAPSALPPPPSAPATLEERKRKADDIFDRDLQKAINASMKKSRAAATGTVSASA